LEYGFKNKNEAIRATIKHLSEQLENQQQLNKSAEFYAEIYETDEEEINRIGTVRMAKMSELLRRGMVIDVNLFFIKGGKPL